MSDFNPLEQAKNSKTFCVLPWVHQYVGPPGDVTPCCVFNSDHNFNGNPEPLGSLKNDTLKEIWNNDNTKKLRLDLLNNKQHPGCNICNNRLHLNDAYKNMFNETFMAMDDVKKVIAQTKPDGSVEDHKLFYLDPRWNNLCNFSCRSCSPHYSSSWIEDHKKLYRGRGKPYEFTFSGKTQDDLLEQVLPHLDTARMIYFAGGEPMMQKDHYEVLKRLIEVGNTDVQIRYNTNFSQLKLKNYDDVLTYWKKFKHVHVMASIDGSYKKAEYWRHGTKWDVIVNNLKRLREECPHVEFRLSYTLSWVNAQNFIELHREWVEAKLIELEDITLNPLDFPPYYSLKNIPEWKKQEIENLFKNYIEWSNQFSNNNYLKARLENAINFMYDENGKHPRLTAMLNDFARYTRRLDEIRGENFFETFPEHENMRIYQWT
jgi:hypothetical protein